MTTNDISPDLPYGDPEGTLADDLNRTYECLIGYSGPLGVFREGDRLDSQHPAVQATPKLWCPADWTSDAKAHARLVRFYG